MTRLSALWRTGGLRPERVAHVPMDRARTGDNTVG